MTEQEMSNVDNVRLWIEALESGEFLQGTECLAPYDDNDVQRYCCLGVAVVVAERTVGGLLKLDGWESDGDWSCLPTVREFYGLTGPDGGQPTLPASSNGRLTCVEANDELQLTFEQIADLLRYDYGIPKENSA